MDIKKYDIILTKGAKTDLEEIYKYIFENLKEPDIAEKLMRKIEKSILSLDTFPNRCMKIKAKPMNQTYRRMVIENYIVLYKVEEEKREVVIYKISYGKRNYLV